MLHYTEVSSREESQIQACIPLRVLMNKVQWQTGGQYFVGLTHVSPLLEILH